MRSSSLTLLNAGVLFLREIISYEADAVLVARIDAVEASNTRSRRLGYGFDLNLGERRNSSNQASLGIPFNEFLPKRKVINEVSPNNYLDDEEKESHEPKCEESLSDSYQRRN